MKKAILSIAVLSALGFSAVSHAAPTVGATGMINFQGEINADTCVVHSAGANSSGGTNLTYQMGSVSANALGTEEFPNQTGGTITTLPVPVNLTMECMNGTNVSLKLTPTTRVGMGVGVSGGAQNVQIMLMEGVNKLDFSSGSYTKANLPLTNGVADISLNAFYTLQQGKGVGDVVAGPANGSVAYELSYE
ncbi:type 1 fimbrial protein [Comamonas sp. Tr-654]|uniref:fimbrial protein n=1 Tax=Comamonas sp. Tr-654 TaxID=2608341 RepID=UPI0014232FC9|nr:type 1 fimbrial protein [Comamonas sp. Tr-654]NIF85154.1 type 1 fimbrial protein [Comamonas sp. Tr-654]